MERGRGREPRGLSHILKNAAGKDKIEKRSLQLEVASGVSLSSLAIMFSFSGPPGLLTYILLIEK